MELVEMEFPMDYVLKTVAYEEPEVLSAEVQFYFELCHPALVQSGEGLFHSSVLSEEDPLAEAGV